MEDLNNVAVRMTLITNSVVEVLKDKLQDCHHQGKSRARNYKIRTN